MVESQRQTEDDGEDPEEVESVVSVGSQYDGAGGLQQNVISVGGQASTEEGGAQVDGDAGEPDHEESEHDALPVVAQHQSHVLRGVLRHNGSVVDHRSQQTNLRVAIKTYPECGPNPKASFTICLDVFLGGKF